MNRRIIGVVDYGIGNHASVLRTFQSLGYRCRLSREHNVLAECDVMVLPGVGAYPAAMAALNSHDLAGFIQDRVRLGQPILGLCLGMQLLADMSYEHTVTAGLGLIPGAVVPLVDPCWHIGWNSIEVVNGDPLLAPSDDQSVYFNHSYVFCPPEEFQVCVAHVGRSSFTVGVRREQVVGLQFHPEKSQSVGRALLHNLIEGLTRA
jgi:glutamine amidotransferase